MWILYLVVAVTFVPYHPLFMASFGPFSVAKYCGMVALVVGVVRAMVRPIAISGCSWRLKAPFMVYATVLLLSSVFRGTGANSLEASGLTKSVSIISTCVMVYLLIDSAERFRGSVRAALCCLTVVSLYAIKQWVAYHNLFADFRGWGGLSGDPNYYAAVVVLWSPVAMITKQPSSLLGWLFRFACGLAIFFAFATAGSRGGLAGLVASGVFLLITHRQVKHTLGALATLTVLVPMLLIMPNSPLRRLTDPTISDQSAVTNRTLFWRAATGTFLDNPIIGVGDQRFAEELWERQKAGRGEHFAHNTYLEMLGRYGLAGGIPFVWLLVAVFSSLGRAARRLGDKELANAARAMQAGVVGYALCIVFVTAWWQMTLWLMIGTAMAMDRILANEASSGRGGPFGDSAPASGGRKALRVAVLDTKRGIPLLARKRNG